jgi:hypothetical protein
LSNTYSAKLKLKFLSNNCSAKKVYFPILLYRQYSSKSLWKVWILVKQLFVKKGVFFHPIVQSICFKKPVESLNSCKKKFRQKRLVFPYYCTGIAQTILKKIDCGSKQFVKHLKINQWHDNPWERSPNLWEQHYLFIYLFITMYVSKSMIFPTQHIRHSRHGLFFTRQIVIPMLNLLKRTMTMSSSQHTIPLHHLGRPNI